MDEQRLDGSAAGEVTGLLRAWGNGDRGALDRLLPLVYQELRRLAHRELRRGGRNQTLSTTALVHEAYLRLVDQDRAQLAGRRHFLNVAAQAMRRVIVDAARRRAAAKRGGGKPELALDEVPEIGFLEAPDLLALDEALTALEAFDPDLGRLVELRYFAGLTLEETADVLGTSTTTAWREWQAARTWLFDRLTPR